MGLLRLSTRSLIAKKSSWYKLHEPLFKMKDLSEQTWKAQESLPKFVFYQVFSSLFIAACVDWATIQKLKKK